ncbi:MAG: putative sulfate exporter family transporter [Actinomycetota bacterium]|nr:putative sulfate exporter family transporter [Actinomycetota bacterium]
MSSAAPGSGPRSFGWLPGIAASAAGAAAGFGIHAAFPIVPWLTASIVLGVIVGCISPARRALDGVLKPGLAIASRRLLRLGIVVLGLKLSLLDIAHLGWMAVLAIIALVGVSFLITWATAKALKLPGDEPVMLAAGFSICGVSAVGAMSAARGTDSRDTGTPIALVTLYGTAAIAVLPALAVPLGLSAPTFGHWVGASVHDVGQVVATAGTAGAAALAVAIVVKLTRVLMLAPMVAITSVSTRRRMAASASATAASTGSDGDDAPAVSRPPIVPLFIIGFVALVLVRTFLPIPDAALTVADIVQSALLAAALFAIGASLRLERLLRSGPRALLAGALSWIAILGLALLVSLVT